MGVEVGAPISTEGMGYEDHDVHKERAAQAIAARRQGADERILQE